MATDFGNAYGTPWPVEVEGYSLVHMALHENKLSIQFKAWSNDDDPTDAEDWLLSGWLKWDGCLEFGINPDNVMHLCDPSHLSQLADLFKAVGDQGRLHISDYLGKF